jgi:hypothetical protein
MAESPVPPRRGGATAASASTLDSFACLFGCTDGACTGVDESPTIELSLNPPKVPCYEWIVDGEHLRLSGPDVTDGLVASMIHDRLKHLELFRCANLTDKGLLHVANNCEALENLDIIRPSALLTRTPILKCVEQCPNLKNLGLPYCVGIVTDDMLKARELRWRGA